MIIAGGGVLYSEASAALAAFAERHGIPVSETQAGKSSLPAANGLNMGSIGVTGSSAANALTEEADVVLAVGSRLQDFTTGSWALFKTDGAKLIGLNVQPFDAGKHRALPLVRTPVSVSPNSRPAYRLAGAGRLDRPGPRRAGPLAGGGRRRHRADQPGMPSDGEVIGAVQRGFGTEATVVCASGGLPGELHKLWQAGGPGSYHLEYGFSTMGYEIAGGLGVKLARPEQEVVVMVGDGSYLMMNSEIASAVMLGVKLTIVVLDNRGYGCINRLQMATGGANFNNLLKDTRHEILPEVISPSTRRRSAPARAR